MIARGSTLLPLLFLVLSRRRSPIIWLLVFVGGWGAGTTEVAVRQAGVSAYASRDFTVAHKAEWEGCVTFRITGWPAESSSDTWKAPARILQMGPGDSPRILEPPLVGEGAYLSGEGDPPSPGDIVTGKAAIMSAGRAGLPGSFDYRLFLAGRGLKWRSRFEDWKCISGEDTLARWGNRIFHPLRNGLRERLARNLPTEETRLASAVLLGIRDAESRRASRPFADLGLAHLFAVSGLHVGILLGIILLPGNLAGLSPWHKTIPIFLLLPVYALLTGLPGSVMRAASLGILALLATAVGRPSDTLRMLGLLFWAGTIWEPVQNLDIGLKLSYLAAGGILGISALTGGLKFSKSRLLGPLGTGVAVSGAAQWFTLPLVAGSFGRISMLSPLANLLAVPIFGLAVWCVVLSLVLSDVWAFGAESSGSLAWFLFRGLAGLTGFVANRSSGYPIGLPAPGVGEVIAWGALSVTGLIILLAIKAGKVSGRLGLISVLVIILVGLGILGPMSWDLRDDESVRAWQFDVGQGDCSLLVLPDGWSLMVDTAGRFGFGASAENGPLPRTVLPFLKRNGCGRMNAVVLTHGHLDHTGGAQALAQGIEVERWYVSGKAGRSITSVADSQTIIAPLAGLILHRWKDWVVEIVYPPHPLPESTHENDYSLVVVLRFGDRDVAVWSGDLELEGETLLLQSGWAPRNIDVWKAGHHGSNTSGSQEILDLFNPKLIILSAGVGNGYKHPNHGAYVVDGDTLAVARTDLQGSITMEWDSKGLFSWESAWGKPNLDREP